MSGNPACERWFSGNELTEFRKALSSVWVALSIVAWTGKGNPAAFKLLPFTCPPFRILIMNEVGDFFSAHSFVTAEHLKRRLRDTAVAGFRGARNCIADAAGLTWSLLYRGGQRVRDLVGLARSLGWRTSERALDLVGLAGSLAWRAGEHVADMVRLAWALLYQLRLRTGERLSGLGLWSREFLLSGLAFLARLTPPISIQTVRNLNGRRSLLLHLDTARDATFIEVSIPARGWAGADIERALSHSRATFVVFRWRGEQRSALKLIHTAIAENAFAVALQFAHSDWRERVVPKHPFRSLQPDEITEVAAPFSSLLVIRRDALLQLGCPQALTWGAALMLLFHQSSAAGFRSLVVGNEAAVPDEPAMVLEDAEFAFRAARSETLMHLGPQNPHSLRGNIAWSPVHQKPFRGKQRVLIVSPYLPFPLSHGGAVRIYNLCRELAGEFDFILASFRESGETVHYEKLHEVFREVYVVDADEKQTDPAVPAQVAEYRNTAMSALIRHFCLEHLVDMVQLEYTQMAEFRNDTGAIPVVLVEHDITFTLHRQLAELNHDLGVRREYERWLAFEREALQCSNTVWTMSGHDREIAVTFGATRGRTQVIPNGVDLRHFQPEPAPPGPPTVLFVGSFRHLPNLLAFAELREKVMPEVWRICPDTMLSVIAGPHYERATEGREHLLLPDPRIQIQGFVADVRPAYAEATVVAIPLPVSAGTNIKLMEAMACGRVVVSTPAGCRGLGLTHGHELMIAELGDGFAEAVIELLANARLRTFIAAEARNTAQRRFGWDSIAREALESYSSVLSTGIPVASRSDAAD